MVLYSSTWTGFLMGQTPTNEASGKAGVGRRLSNVKCSSAPSGVVVMTDVPDGGHWWGGVSGDPSPVLWFRLMHTMYMYH